MGYEQDIFRTRHGECLICRSRKSLVIPYGLKDINVFTVLSNPSLRAQYVVANHHHSMETFLSAPAIAVEFSGTDHPLFYHS